jgi:predicted DNA-binding transcriptional regulator AlpA
MPEPLLCPEEVAAIIGMTPKEVRAMCRPGGIPYFRLSSQTVRFDRIKVEAWAVARRAA